MIASQREIVQTGQQFRQFVRFWRWAPEICPGDRANKGYKSAKCLCFIDLTGEKRQDTPRFLRGVSWPFGLLASLFHLDEQKMGNP
jgi:hypothetical protein